jgi:hypothetical protein
MTEAVDERGRHVHHPLSGKQSTKPLRVASLHWLQSGGSSAHVQITCPWRLGLIEPSLHYENLRTGGYSCCRVRGRHGNHYQPRIYRIWFFKKFILLPACRFCVVCFLTHFFCGTGNGIQNLVCARQALCHWATSLPFLSSWFFLFVFVFLKKLFFYMYSEVIYFLNNFKYNRKVVRITEFLCTLTQRYHLFFHLLSLCFTLLFYSSSSLFLFPFFFFLSQVMYVCVCLSIYLSYLSCFLTHLRIWE